MTKKVFLVSNKIWDSVYKSHKLELWLDLGLFHRYSCKDLAPNCSKLIGQLRAPTQGVRISWWVRWKHWWIYILMMYYFYHYIILWYKNNVKNVWQKFLKLCPYLCWSANFQCPNKQHLPCHRPKLLHVGKKPKANMRLDREPTMHNYQKDWIFC